MNKRELTKYELEVLETFEQILKDVGISKKTRKDVEDAVDIIKSSRQRRKTKNKQE